VVARSRSGVEGGGKGATGGGKGRGAMDGGCIGSDSSDKLPPSVRASEGSAPARGGVRRGRGESTESSVGSVG